MELFGNHLIENLGKKFGVVLSVALGHFGGVVSLNGRCAMVHSLMLVVLEILALNMLYCLLN